MVLAIDSMLWASLWSGLLGSIPATAAATLVALHVLSVNNASQRDALASQREALQLQLDEQKREATKNRENAAIADVVTSAQRVGRVHKKTWLDIVEENLAFEAALMRWRIEANDENLIREMEAWSTMLAEVAPNSDAPISPHWQETSHAVSLLVRDLALAWPFSSEKERRRLLVDALGKRLSFIKRSPVVF